MEKTSIDFRRDAADVRHGHRVISGAVDLGFRSALYGWKAKT